MRRQQHATIAINFDFSSMTDQQALDATRGGIKAGQCFDFFFDQLPFRERVYQKTGLFGIDRDNHFAMADFKQAHTVARGKYDSPLRVQ